MIEDNAHGFGGTLDGTFLGRFGDIGFSTTRKQFSSMMIGLLYLKSSVAMHKFTHLPIDRPSAFTHLRGRVGRSLPKLKSTLRYMRYLVTDYTDPASFVENELDYKRPRVRYCTYSKKPIGMRIRQKDAITGGSGRHFSYPMGSGH